MNVKRAFILIIGLCAQHGLLAQTTLPAPRHFIRGTVFDSVAGRPLSDAVVEAVAVDSAGASVDVDPRAHHFTAITTPAGDFEIAGLPPGRYALGFQHDALNALGLESPLTVVLLDDSLSGVRLATPSGHAVRTLNCPASKPGDGVLLGYVVDASTGAPLAGARVEAQWGELDAVRKSLKVVPHTATADVAPSGRYRTCDVPSESPVVVHVSRRGFHEISSVVSIPEAGAVRRDFQMVSDQATHGSARVIARVVDTSGASVMTGHAILPLLDRDVPIAGGKVTFNDVPTGSWSVGFRAFGYEPLETTLTATTGDTATATVMLTPVAVMLDTITSRSLLTRGDQSTLLDINKRMLTASGTLITQDNPYLQSALFASDPLRAARGFSYIDPTHVKGRPYVTKNGRLMDCTNTGSTDSGKVVAIYLDGGRYRGSLEFLVNDVLPRQILAIEAYPDVVSAPGWWRTNDACAVIAFWTIHGKPKPP